MSIMASSRCPCLSGLPYGECCAPLHTGVAALTADALMRSRFSAFAIGDVDYLRETWHPTTRPHDLDLDEGLRWYRLDILDRVAGGLHDDKGVVEFEAFFRGTEIGSQRERSTFVRESGRWFYLSA